MLSPSAAVPSVKRNASFNHIPKKRKIQPVDEDDDNKNINNTNNNKNTAIEANHQLALSGICPPLASTTIPPLTPSSNEPNGNNNNKPPPKNVYSVFKFGGSSVGTPSRLRSVISTIERLASNNKTNSEKLAVVVSAQGNTTDWLLDAADYATAGNLEAALACVDRVAELAITNAVAVSGRGEVASVRKFLDPLRKIIRGMSLLKEGTSVSLDFALSFGERLSAFIMTQILNARNINAIYLDARSWVETDDSFGQAKVNFAKSCQHINHLWHAWGDAVVVCTGFVGQTCDGRTTTLGRNGSDYTATLLAGALRANKVVINTDVDGVMTADPRIVQDAVPVAELSYREALGLADYGTGMFHPRTFIPLIETNVPMYIRNSVGRPDAIGTRISSNGLKEPTSDDNEDDNNNNSSSSNNNNNSNVKNKRPTCVTSLEKLAMIEIVSRREQGALNLFQFGGKISKILAEAGVNVFMESQAAHGQSVVVLVHMNELERSKKLIGKDLDAWFKSKDLDPIHIIKNVTMLSVVQGNIREMTNVAARFTGTLGALGVNILAVAEGSHSFTCTIPGAMTQRAVLGVHSSFNLSCQRCSLVIVAGTKGLHGSGTTSSSLIKVLEEQANMLERDQEVQLKVVGTVSEYGCLFEKEGLGLKDALDSLLRTDRHSNNNNNNDTNGVPVQSQVLRHSNGKSNAVNTANSTTTVVGNNNNNNNDDTIEGKLFHAIEFLKDLPNPIFVDCSGRNGEQQNAIYKRCLDLGISIVLSSSMSICGLSENVLPMTASARLFGGHSTISRNYCGSMSPKPSSSPVFSSSSSSSDDDNNNYYDNANGESNHVVPFGTSAKGAYLFFDSTVGGSLPILSTLRSLLKTGDRVVSLECALSGSMNAITCDISQGTSLSNAIEKACMNKYMEEDPRVDLLGLDFVRKLVVIARQIGVAMTVDDVEVTPLIPEDVLGTPDLSNLLMTNDEDKEMKKNIIKYETTFQKLYGHQKDKVIRFAGCINIEYSNDSNHNKTITRAKATIGPKIISNESPLYNLRGKEVFASFKTERHSTFPLILFGAGQGGKEGACGVLGDIIRVSQQLRGVGSY